MRRTHASLFTGIGGLDLAAEAAGFHTVLQVEKDEYCRKVLAQHWPGVERLGDINDVEETHGPVDLVSGGFPCQPFSIAGKQRGTDDDRYLWPEMLRAIRRLQPEWVVAENVPRIVSLHGGAVLARIYRDLGDIGYEGLPPLVFPAAAFGAPHLRYRCFIIARRTAADTERNPVWLQWAEMADSDSRGFEVEREQESPGVEGTRRCEPDGCGEVREQQHSAALPIPSSTGLEEREGAEGEWAHASVTGGDWWAVEPNVDRVAHGIPNRVDRLKALGNAVVPKQAVALFRSCFG